MIFLTASVQYQVLVKWNEWSIVSTGIDIKHAPSIVIILAIALFRLLKQVLQLIN